MGFLTDDIIQNLEIKDKSYKVSHEQSLHLYVTSTGNKIWRFKYHFNKKSRSLVIGKYPMISIDTAMERLKRAKDYIAQGIDPNVMKKLNKTIKPKDIKKKVSQKDKYLAKISSQLTKINRNILKLLEAIEKK